MLILASNSPRRRELLSLVGWQFDLFSVEIPEMAQPGELPDEYVLRLAREKSRTALESIRDRYPQGEIIVLAADTAVVEIAGHGTGMTIAEDAVEAHGGYRILGKPVDADDAVHMLRRLRGRPHEVLTGISLVRSTDDKSLTDFCSTKVHMRAYRDEEIEAYVKSGDPLDKAGGYAIQHRDFNPAARIDGCFANVMGLPLCMIAGLLEEVGLPPANDLPWRCQEGLEFDCEVYTQ